MAGDVASEGAQVAKHFIQKEASKTEYIDSSPLNIVDYTVNKVSSQDQ